MAKLIKFLAAQYAIILALITFNAILINVPRTYKFKSPTDDGFSVLAAKSKKIDKEYKIYGFLPYWKLNKVEFLQMDKITDIAYFGLAIDKEGKIRTRDHEGNIDPAYNNWVNNENLDKLLQMANESNTRVALSVVSHEAEITDTFLACETCWDTFMNELVAQLASKGIKDVNFDFEYGGYTDEKTADQYTKLVDLTNKRLDQEFGDSYVTVAAFADSFVKPRVTKVDDLAKVSDAIFIMAYDFHRPTSDRAGPIAPIDGAGVYSEYDISTMFKDYLKNTAPNKLILGVPYYGYNWVVEEDEPYSERIEGSDVLGYSVSQTYAKVMDTIIEVDPEVLWDARAKAPYFSYVSPNTGSLRMVYFENQKSLRAKYRLAKKLDLGGVGIWALGYDGGYQELWDLLEEEFII